MVISYNWLKDYLPVTPDPEKLSQILTSIGLEVESMLPYASIKGGLNGLLVGEVIHCEKHPEADKLKLTKVHIGTETPLHIVCGAPNVAVGQKVIVAPVGCTIYPTNGEPLTLKKAKIRGAESEGMLCAEDEVGLGNSHDGLFILPKDAVTGTALSELFPVYTDIIFEIGLTPNRSDAMSHWGVARDVCAYLSYHEGKQIDPIAPALPSLTKSPIPNPISIEIEKNDACKRYCGIVLSGVTVGSSPQWLKDRLQAIGQKSINNIVDITNYILHDTGQPLHAFDADKIVGKKVIVKSASKDERFKTLDEKERILTEADLMICNASTSMCMAGVYGGLDSGVTMQTKNIFLESAWFHPTTIRRTSMHHGLRTDAATRFEKGVDISQTFSVLQRASAMMADVAGGTCSQATDIYPDPVAKKTISFPLSFLKKLSGKIYEKAAVLRILKALGFEVTSDEQDELTLAVPHSKHDVHIPADIVEEVMRMDGLDNIPIPSVISIAPNVEKFQTKAQLRDKIANDLAGMGFREIMTNSIINSALYSEDVQRTGVKMLNSLSAELDMMRPDLLRSGLQVIANNINHKNNDLLLFEFGKTYKQGTDSSTYNEEEQLALYATGITQAGNWKQKEITSDFYFLKGILEKYLRLMHIRKFSWKAFQHTDFAQSMEIAQGKLVLGCIGIIAPSVLKKNDVKHPVFYAQLNMSHIYGLSHHSAPFRELPKYPSVHRDLALVVDKKVSYDQIESIALSSKIDLLKSVQLFDIFESEKIGVDKKSMAVSFTFLNEQKTMTDEEIEQHMKKLIAAYEQGVNAEIRK